jgi:hypothetical protein
MPEFRAASISTMHRLESISADLDAKLRSASPAQQRAAMLTACEFALKHSGVKNATIAKGIGELRRTGAISPGLCTDLQAIVEQLDEDAFRAQEAVEAGHGSWDEYLAAYSRARCGAALSFAGLADPLQAAVEAIYEAAMTSDDPEEIISVLQSAL